MMSPCLSFPLPDALEEFLAAEVVLGFPFLLLDLLFDHHLRGDGRRGRGAGQPEDFFAVHAGFAAEDVLDWCLLRTWPMWSHAGDVRRRDDDGIGGLRRCGIGDKTVPAEPELIPFILNRLRFVSFRNHFRIRAYSMLSTRAWSEAVMMFFAHADRPQSRLPSLVVINTRVWPPCRWRCR